MVSTGRVMHAFDTENFPLGMSDTSGVAGKSSTRNLWLPQLMALGISLILWPIIASVGCSMPQESQTVSSPRKFMLIPALRFLQPGG